MICEEGSFQSPKTRHQTTHASELSEDVNLHPQIPKDLEAFWLLNIMLFPMIMAQLQQAKVLTGLIVFPY